MTEQICDQNKGNFQEDFKNPKEKNNSSEISKDLI